MSSAALPSNIRVFVTFKEDTIFAGEELDATITFKNVDQPPRTAADQKPRSRVNAIAHSRAPSTPSQLPSRPTHSRQTSIASHSQPPKGASSKPSALGHRQAQSLTLPDGSNSTAAARSPGHLGSHGRSVSIVSLGSDKGGSKKKGWLSSVQREPAQRDPARPGYKLARSFSVQMSPAGNGKASPRWNSLGGNDPIRAMTPASGVSTAPLPQGEFPWAPSPLASSTLPGSPSPLRTNNGLDSGVQSPRLSQSRTASGRIQQTSKYPPSSFKFPPSPSGNTPAELPQSADSSTTVTPNRPEFLQHTSAPTLANTLSTSASDLRPPMSRVFSLSSDVGTARSSIDMNSVSNNSEDTSASEHGSAANGRLLARRPESIRKPSQLSKQAVRKRQPETLMMGFAQISGFFTLDGSLVNQAPFEEVKRRAVVGGQGGGGVVGLDQSSKTSENGSMFGGFSWGNIGESLGGLLGGSEPSSLREMKGIAQSKSIPLLSTPKSILFVDLKLAPGESRSYAYAFPLPRGLPPSHRGRAMKVVYQLVIGTQRPGSSKNARLQQIRQVEVPFRLFGGVDSHGETLGHDLMSPYIILRDHARTAALDATAHDPMARLHDDRQPLNPPPKQTSSEDDFNTYVNSLFTSKNRRNSSAGLLSPTAGDDPETPRSRAMFPDLPPLSTRALIDYAIRTSTQPLTQHANTASTSQTNFTIARGGIPIAQLTLSRPALRLGDLLHLALDFEPATLASSPISPQNRPLVHALTLTLESSETVDSALAIRSHSSVERATRRVWDRRVVGGTHGAALGWCRRWAGTLKVPTVSAAAHGATPGFTTTGVGVAWCVRVELAVGLRQAPPAAESPESEDEEDERDDGETGELQRNDDGEPSPSRNDNAHRRETGIARTSRATILLESLAEDERGVTLASVPRVPAESFDVAVPIRVFGAVGAGAVGTEFGPQGEGLAI